MAPKGLFCADVLRPLDLVPLTDFSYKYHPGPVCRLPPDVPAHNILQHCVNLSQGRCPAPDWKQTDLTDQGRPGYNRWKRITGAPFVVIGAGSLVVEVVTALAGQAQQ